MNIVKDLENNLHYKISIRARFVICILLFTFFLIMCGAIALHLILIFNGVQSLWSRSSVITILAITLLTVLITHALVTLFFPLENSNAKPKG